MNGIGMLMPQVQLLNKSVSSTSALSKNESALPFQQLLHQEMPEMHGNEKENKDLQTLVLELIHSKGIQSEEQTLSESDLKEIVHFLQQFLQSADVHKVEQDISAIWNQLESGEKVSLDMIVEQLGLSEEKAQVNEWKLENMDSIVPMMNVEMITDEQTKQEFQTIWIQVEAVLRNLTTKEDLQQAAPKLLELVQQWLVLERQSTSMDGNSYTTKQHSNEILLWKDFIQFYRQRHQLSTKQMYTVDAKVTHTDVTKWLETALERHGLMENKVIQPVTFQTGTSLGKVEQYVVYLNQNEISQTVDKQLLEQFQKVIKTSKFLTQANGTNQLSIRLQPENLGNLLLRFTQVDGEMLVKISVTTQAAKEMLERNMHQLKHMFSPHQVVIEKQDAQIQQSQPSFKGQQEEELEQQGNPNQQEQDGHATQDENEVDFKEILNEKV